MICPMCVSTSCVVAATMFAETKSASTTTPNQHAAATAETTTLLAVDRGKGNGGNEWPIHLGINDAEVHAGAFFRTTAAHDDRR